MGKFPVVVPIGVPLMVPLFRVNPAGSEPTVIVHVYGRTPPVACRVVVVYGTPSVPFGRLVVVIFSGLGG